MWQWGKKAGLFLLTVKSQFPKVRVHFLYCKQLYVQESMMRPLPIMIKDEKLLNKTLANQIQEFPRQYSKIFANFKCIYPFTKQFHFQSSFLPNIENIHTCTCKHKCVSMLTAAVFEQHKLGEKVSVHQSAISQLWSIQTTILCGHCICQWTTQRSTRHFYTQHNPNCVLEALLHLCPNIFINS